MVGTAVRSLCWLLALLECLSSGSADRDPSCQDERTSCRRIGTRLPLSRCYKKSNECCATCTRLRLDVPGCPYGDRGNGCGSIGGDRPISDCYTENATCCGTCALYSRGTPGCEFGDRLNWCSEIGSRYQVSTCYQEETNCCDTCSRFKKDKPGCAYGDHANWCSVVGVEFCKTDPYTCCQTCQELMATTTTAAPQADEPRTTLSHMANVTHNNNQGSNSNQTPTTSSVHHTYTGSPGRPNPGDKDAVTPAPAISSSHSTHSTTVLNNNNKNNSNPTLPSSVTPKSTLDKSANTTTTTLATPARTNNTNRDVIICANVTNHRIRHHNKHGGRHRSREGGNINPLCVNATSQAVSQTEVVPTRQTSEPLWVIISKGLAPQTSATEPKSSRTDSDKSKEEQVATWSNGDVRPTDSMTTKLGSGLQGEMDYQEDYVAVFSSASSHSKSTTRSSLLLQMAIFGLLLLLCSL